MDVHQVVNRVAKWRSVFAAWQLGTRPADDAECKAVKDHREITMMLRIEVNTLSRLLIEKRVFTSKEWTEMLGEEAVAYERMLEVRFPGIKATDLGMSYDPAVAQKTMEGWPP